MENININNEQVAKICHEVNRLYCEMIGDDSQLDWEHAPAWQVVSAINGVKFHRDNPGAKPSDSHDNWIKQKKEDGWAYGPEKIPRLKIHPCIVPYGELPLEQRVKDSLFISIVNSLSGRI